MLRSHSWERRRTSHDLLALQIQVRDGQLGHLHMRNIVQSPLQVLLRMEDEHIILIYCDVSTLLAPTSDGPSACSYWKKCIRNGQFSNQETR